MCENLKKLVLTVIFVASATLAANSQSTSEKTLYGVTTAGELIAFKSTAPKKLMKMPKLGSMQSGERLVGIDFRPSNKMLYGVTNQNRIFTINPATGIATAVGVLTTSLAGSSHGVDFNPVPDRIRITNDSEQNLRANPVDAANVADKPLTFKPDDANSAANPNIVASAYTNNVAGTKTTTLYNIDSNLDALLTQNPPNDGILNTVGKLGFNVTANAGFDIVTAGDANMAFAALQIEGEKTSRLYSINLTTGAATLIGKINAKAPLVALAVSLD